MIRSPAGGRAVATTLVESETLSSYTFSSGHDEYQEVTSRISSRYFFSFLPYFDEFDFFVAKYPCSSPPDIRHDLMKYSMNGKQWKNTNLKYMVIILFIRFFFLFSFMFYSQKCSSV